MAQRMGTLHIVKLFPIASLSQKFNCIWCLFHSLFNGNFFSAKLKGVGIEVLTAVVMKGTIWDTMPHSLLKVSQRFGGTRHHLQG
jgi:hypothetical protein